MVFQRDQNGNKIAIKEGFMHTKEGADGSSEKAIYEQWWFWLIIAVVIALAVLGYVYREKIFGKN